MKSYYQQKKIIMLFNIDNQRKIVIIRSIFKEFLKDFKK